MYSLIFLLYAASGGELDPKRLKEEFRKIYETSENPTEGMLSISEWLAKSSSVFTKSCQTIRNWFGEIIGYFEGRTRKVGSRESTVGSLGFGGFSRIGDRIFLL